MKDEAAREVLAILRAIRSDLNTMIASMHAIGRDMTDIRKMLVAHNIKRNDYA